MANHGKQGEQLTEYQRRRRQRKAKGLRATKSATKRADQRRKGK